MDEGKWGPKLPISQTVHETKYRQRGETFYQAGCRIASALADDDQHRKRILSGVLEQRILFAGRVQASVGAARRTTPYNCYVMGIIPDSMQGIMQSLSDSAETMRLGGGIGEDFSTLRPKNSLITSLDTYSSGPVSFMIMWDAMCQTIKSAGHRRGAMMAVMRVDHPDIRDFLYAKHTPGNLTNFNVSIGITDEFMVAVEKNLPFDLKFEGKVHKTIDARNLWDEIMRSTWDQAEPGVIFLDTINRMNNLWYCENITTTNPCGEQPLPPYGACLLASLNLVKYVTEDGFNWELYVEDMQTLVRALDNVIDNAVYPLPPQEVEATTKRRMGIGVTGLANALEMMGMPYGSLPFIKTQIQIHNVARDTAYATSVQLAREKGPFEAYSRRHYLEGAFIKTLPPTIRADISRYGIRNSHLLSIAPTGTISLTADNVSSGIEPVWRYYYDRTVHSGILQTVERITDYAYREAGVRGKTVEEVTLNEHLSVVKAAQDRVDSAVSKTINVGKDVDWETFKGVYYKAWKSGLKGCTTFRDSGKREGIYKEVEGDACFIDPETGAKSCAE